MPVYYFLLDAPFFEQEIRPALAASWRERSFAPCRPVCRTLLAAAHSFLHDAHTRQDDSLIDRVANGLAFDRHFWTSLAGEMVLFAAKEIPEIQIAPETLCWLLTSQPDREGLVPRERFAPIQQAHYGSQYLTFGSRTYRPQACGINESDDVRRLGRYLADLRPNDWTSAALEELIPNEGDRDDELEFAREWFPALLDLYHRAESRQQIVIAEML
jgi:hypothetical protein